MTTSKAIINKPVPDFSIPATNNQTITLSNLLGKNIVLYFYPKDCTSGCTLEGQDFRDYYTEFKKLNAEILGLSRDTIKLHEKFKSETFEALIDDTSQRIAKISNEISDRSWIKTN
jgi:peroxiredoxin Q/BCP